MNFLEVAHSKKRFRQEGSINQEWFRVEDGKMLSEKGTCVGVTIDQILATNWELEETMVRICKTTYWAAAQAVFSDCAIGIDTQISAAHVLKKLTLLAVKLGVEDYTVGKA